MNDQESSQISQRSPIIIKISVPETQHGRTASSPSFWRTLGWKLTYWWHSHWQAPEWKSAYTLAILGTLLFAALIVAASSANFQEAGMRLNVARHENGAAEAGESATAVAVPTATYAAGGAVYVVQPGDTLYRIADRYETSMAALDQINRLNGTIEVGQVLVIPPANFDGSTSQMASPTNNYACAQFSFAQGDGRGAQAGVYVLHDVTGGQVAAWSAPSGAQNSGWIYNVPVSFASVHVRVLFYPRYGGGTAVEMNILNHAPDTTEGWLTRGMCHSLELAYADG